MSSFKNLQQPTKGKLTIAEQTYLFFGGTAYLGLLADPEYISLYKKGIDKYGLNNGTSRANNVQLGIYEEAEDKLASRFGFGAAAVFSSGYLAAQATVKAVTRGREVIYAPGSHPALWLEGDPNVMGSFATWSVDTLAYINNSPHQSFVVISNCIDNLQPATYDFSIFSQVAADKEVLFILDDSHGLGILNKNAISTDLSLLKAKGNLEFLVVCSLAKGLGTDAGLVLGTHKSLEKVKKQPIFTGASPCSPAAMYALIYGDAVYERSFAQLQHNIRYFKDLLLGDKGLISVDKFPIFTAADADLYSYLCAKQILISSFPYPLASSSLLNRIVISAGHSDLDLNKLAQIYLGKKK